MATRTVQAGKRIAASADAVWAVARDFCDAWHPLVEWMKPEHGTDGRLTRQFKVKGEDTLYRERMTYFSDTDRELRYCHVAGIGGVTSYEASLQVLPEGNGCRVHWKAVVEAPEPRAGEIARGTGAIFEMGLAALEEKTALRDARIAGDPALAVTHGVEHAGPLVLFLHGIGGGRRNWTRQLQAASLTHQAAALDLRGYGASSLGPRQTTIDDHCDDIRRVMAQFKASRVILCGMSLGSWIATSFAMRHPEALAGLVLSGGCTGMSEASVQEREAFLSARRVPLDQGLSPKDFAPQLVNVIAGPHASDAVRTELLESMAAIPTGTYRDALWCFTHPEERFDFSRITCPVLMMTGEHDRLATPGEIRNVAQRIHSAARNADVGFEVIPAAGHLCNIENPAAYNNHLTRFLRRLS